MLTTVGALSCASNTGGSLDPEQVVLYPPPPNTPRIQFLTHITTSEDLGAGTSFFQRIIGEEERVAAIVQPYGVAIHRGKIYVCDAGVGGLVVADLAERRMDVVQPRGVGQLRFPINCFVDSEGTLYVADTQGKRVVVYDSSGSFVSAIGGAGALVGDEEFAPGDVFVRGDTLWVSDMGTGRVHVHERASLQRLFSFPEDPEPSSPEVLAAPANIYVTAAAVYVSDVLRARVNVYEHDGTYLRTVGTRGTGFGQFARPKGIAVDREENLYVVDAAFQNVQVFDREGGLLMIFGGGGNGPGEMILPAKVIVDYANLSYFERYVHPDLAMKYLVIVTNQYGPNKVNVYGFVGADADSAATN